MNSPTAAVPLQDLLQNLDWVRGVARAVAGEAEADDLAQEVWLKTAERPPQQAATARAWLGRVLRNAHAARRRTDARRRQREEFAAVGADAATMESPDEIVARAEAQRRLVEALFQLDSGSRQILILRYFQQWTPAQIASSLGEPAGTVRARLSRSLARLRQRLGRDLGRTEANLLIAGAAGLAQPASSAIPLAAAAAGICVVALTAVVLLNRERPAELSPSGTGVLMASDTAGMESAPPASGALLASGPPAAITRAPARAAARGSFTVSGRCVAGPTGGALAGVILSVHLDNSCWPLRPEECAQHVQIETRTDAGGFFNFSFDPPAPEFRIEWRAEGWVTRHAYWRETPAAAEDLGEIRMDPGLPVAGRVVNDSGQAVAGVMVIVDDLPMSVSPAHVFADGFYARSGPSGEFTMPLLVPAGVWPLRVEGRGSVLLGPSQLELPGAGLSAPLVVRIRQMPGVQGRCVDAEGTPVALALLEGRLADGSNAWYSTWTAADGSFAVYPSKDAELSSRVRLTAKASGWLDVTEPVESSWGTGDLIIAMQRAPELIVEVVDQATGQPVTDFTVYVEQYLESGKTLQPEQYDGPHAAGRALCPVQLGGSLVRVAPASESYAVPETGTVQCNGAAPEALRVELVPTAVLRVELIADGQPLAGALVECFLPGSRPMGLGERATLLRSEGAFRRPGSRLWSPFKESERTTDAAGLVALPTQPEAGARWLRLTGPFEHFVKEVQFDPSAAEPIRLEVIAGCRFQGTLRSRWTQWPETFLILEPEGNTPGWGSGPNDLPSYHLPVEKDGRFDLSGIRSGRYDLYLDYDLSAPFPASTKVRMGMIPTGGSLGTFALQPDLEEPWTLEFPDREPGLIDLTVLLDGAPPADCALALFHVDDQRTARIHAFALDAEGRLHSDWVTPGRTRAYLQRMDEDGERVLRTWASDEEFLVIGGGTTTRQIDFKERRIRVRVTDQDGLTPLPNVKVDARGRIAGYEVRTDADGWFEFDGVPVSPVKIVVYQEGVDPWQGEISWTAAETDVVRTLIRP